jgi:hypothetical protein
MGFALDTETPDAVPYFNWDAPVTNSEVRRILAEGDEESRLFWIARIMTEARYDDVWRYVSLRSDVLPRWDALRGRLGRRRDLWEFLITRWRELGLIPKP